MPAVPLYPVGGRVAPEARGPVYQTATGATLDAFSSTGEGMQKASQKLDQLSAQLAGIAQDDNEREAKKLDIEIAQRRDRLLWGDGTEQNPGFLSAKGENALAVAASTQQALQKLREEVLGSAKNQKVRQLAEAMSAQQIEAGLNLVNRHTTEQRIDANKTVSEARMQAEISSAAKNWNYPAAMAKAGKTLNGEILSLQRQNGWSDEVAAQKLAEARGHLVSSVVKSALAADNVEAAQGILDANEKGLPANARVELYTLLRNQSVEKQGQALGDTLWAKFGSDVKGALAHLQGVASGKVRDAAWAQWQKIVDASRSQIERGRTDANYKREEAKRLDPVMGDDATKAWTYYTRSIQQNEAQRAIAERQAEAVAKAARDEWQQEVVKSGGILDLTKLFADERLARHPEQKVELQRFAEAFAKGEPPAAVSRKTTADLYSRIALPEGDPQKIVDMRPMIQEFGNGNLGKADMEFLQKALENGVTPEGSRLNSAVKTFLDEHKSQFTKTNIFGSDALGDLSFGDFHQYVDEQIAAAKKAGKDPMLLLRRGNPEYLGNEGVIAQFQRSAEAQLEEKVKTMDRPGGANPYKLPQMKNNPDGTPAKESIELYSRLPSKAFFLKPDGSKAQKP